MGRSSGSTVTQSSTSEPWKEAQPHLKNLFTQLPGVAANGFNPWSGPTYVPPNQQEMVGLNEIENVARTTNPMLAGLGNRSAEMLSGGGFAAPLSRIASGEDAIQVTPFGRDNADFRGLVDRSVRTGVDEVNSLFSAGGRYGSEAHQGGVQERAGDIAGGMYANQYNQDADRFTQQQAANIANRAGASSALMGQFNSLAGLAPTINDMRYADARQLVDVGGALRGEAQDELQSYIGQWDANQQAPVDRLLFQAGVLGGMGGLGKQTTDSVPQGSRISGLLGGATMGAAAGSKIMPGVGTAIGGGLGGLLGLFA